MVSQKPGHASWGVLLAAPLKVAVCIVQKFNKWIEKSLEASPQSAIAVYPEGHRSTHGASLPLKRGMLHFAFSRKMPIQVVIGANKEAILSEKHCTARFGQTVVVGYSGETWAFHCEAGVQVGGPALGYR